VVSDIVEFVTARLNAEEREAITARARRDLDIARGAFLQGSEPPVPDTSVGWTDDRKGGAWVLLGPERLLRSIAAMRQIVEQALAVHDEGQGDGATAGDEILLAVASIWSGHPQFDPQWLRSQEVNPT